jgi:hypothetical protein
VNEDPAFEENLNRVTVVAILAEFCVIGNTPELLWWDLEATIKPEWFIPFCLALACWISHQ